MNKALNDWNFFPSCQAVNDQEPSVNPNFGLPSSYRSQSLDSNGSELSVGSSTRSSVQSINPSTGFYIRPELTRRESASISDKKKLFVGNLPANTTLAELLEIFRKYGPVNEQLSVVKDDNYAFIHYYNDNDAMRAIEAVNDSFFKNRVIRVQNSTSQGHIKKNKSEFPFNSSKHFYSIIL